LIAQRFPKATILKKKHSDNDWFSELYHRVEMRACALAIKRGDPVKTATLGIRRELFSRICKAHMKLSTSASYEERAVVVSLHHAVGRGGEISGTTFEGMQWSEEDNAAWTVWPETKTGQSGDISFHADSSCYD
jgi:hypothetical protein